MKSFVQRGDDITVLAAPYAVASGGGMLVGALFGVAAGTIAQGAEGEIKTSGVFDLPAAPGDTPTQGVIAYWDDTAKRVTTTATNNAKIGVFVLPKAGGATVGRVRLHGAVL